ncbi:AP-3 complex subunit beta-1 isoform X1 [Osmerus mordax]|uniref:AP-3 complex subunit beta-1 isoform X1 n=2 Tax=Osmerus mordax TaxID=8014 RepID=UPI0035104A67
MSEKTITDKTTSDRVVVTLCFLLVFLILLLAYLYMKLNRETSGQYTLRRMVYREGGVRDRVRGGVRTLETRLGRRLWPLNENEEEIEGEESEEERDVEEGSKRGESEGEGDEGDDSSDDYSSLEGCNLRGRAGGAQEREGRRESKGSMESEDKKDGAREDGGVKAGLEEGEGNRGGDLQIGLKHFSGSATWSEEQKKQEDDNNVTAF